jgi:hypothetical protein
MIKKAEIGRAVQCKSITINYSAAISCPENIRKVDPYRPANEADHTRTCGVYYAKDEAGNIDYICIERLKGVKRVYGADDVAAQLEDADALSQHQDLSLDRLLLLERIACGSAGGLGR